MVQVGVVWTFWTEFGRKSEGNLEGILLLKILPNSWFSFISELHLLISKNSIVHNLQNCHNYFFIPLDHEWHEAGKMTIYSVRKSELFSWQNILAFWGIVLAGDISAFLLARLLGQCLSNARNDVLVGVPYASSDEFTEFLFLIQNQFH